MKMSIQQRGKDFEKSIINNFSLFIIPFSNSPIYNFKYIDFSQIHISNWHILYIYPY